MNALAGMFTHYGLPWPSRHGEAKIRCPLGTHDDTHPSATVNTVTGLWQCFTCAQGGDVYTLVMEREQVGFKDAKQIVDSTTDGSVRQVRDDSNNRLGHLFGGKRDPRGGDRTTPAWLRH